MKKFTSTVLILALVGIALYFLLTRNINTREVANNPVNNSDSVSSATEYTTYKSSEYSPEFMYPKAWGEVTIKEGNKTCPEEDTYRTQDTLNVFDWEFSFAEMKLPGSDSFIRTGIRTYELDTKNLNSCGDEFFLGIATKEFDPEILSSVNLTRIDNNGGLFGIFNPEASRLNTESRVQYTFFVKGLNKIHVLQSYMSFIPYFDSPELNEMENEFGGDMMQYMEKGKTSAGIRSHLAEFIKMSEDLKFKGE